MDIGRTMIGWVVAGMILTGAAQAGDAPAHPVAFEPFQSGTWKANVEPCMALQHSDWAKEPCYLDAREDGHVVMGNGFLEVELALEPKPTFKLVRLKNKATGRIWECPEDKASPFCLSAAAGADISCAKLPEANLCLKSADFPEIDPRPGADGTDDACSFVVGLTGHTDASISMEFRLRRTDHFFSCRATVTNAGEKNLAVLSVGMPSVAPRVGWLTRWRLDTGGKTRTMIEGYPGQKVGFLAKPGESFTTRWFDCQIVGKGDWQEWEHEYWNRVAPPRPPHPFVHYQGWYGKQIVFHGKEPTSLEDADRIIGVFHRMGGKSFHPSTWAYDSYGWTKDSDAYKRILELNTVTREKYGIAVSLGCHWGSDVKGNCVLSGDTKAYMAKQHAAFRERGSEMFGVDFFGMKPCDNAEHGHFPGDYSMYPQVRSLTEWFDTFRGEETYMGGWLGISRSFGIHLDTMHYGSDGTGGQGCDIHLDRLRVEETAHGEGPGPSVLTSRLLGHMGHDGFENEFRLHDPVGWRYALLTRMTICPNVNFEFISPDIDEKEIAFTRSWTDWAARNADTLFEARRLTFDQKQAPIRLYSHVIRDRGFVALVNPGYAPQTAELNLAPLGTVEGGLYAAELYPVSRGLNDGKPLDSGAPLLIDVAPVTAMILRVGPKDYVDAAQPGLGTPPVPNENYLREWKEETGGDGSVFTCAFDLFPALKEFLAGKDAETPEEKWKACPCAYRKAYLVLCLDTTAKGGRNALEGISASLAVNGADVPVHTLGRGKHWKTGGYKWFYCHFADVGAVLTDGKNEIKVRLSSPVEGTTFRGAWLDWPRI